MIHKLVLDLLSGFKYGKGHIQTRQDKPAVKKNIIGHRPGYRIFAYHYSPQVPCHKEEKDH